MSNREAVSRHAALRVYETYAILLKCVLPAALRRYKVLHDVLRPIDSLTIYRLMIVTLRFILK